MCTCECQERCWFHAVHGILGCRKPLKGHLQAQSPPPTLLPQVTTQWAAWSHILLPRDPRRRRLCGSEAVPLTQARSSGGCPVVSRPVPTQISARHSPHASHGSSCPLGGILEEALSVGHGPYELERTVMPAPPVCRWAK